MNKKLKLNNLKKLVKLEYEIVSQTIGLYYIKIIRYYCC